MAKVVAGKPKSNVKSKSEPGTIRSEVDPQLKLNRTASNSTYSNKRYIKG